MAIFIYILKFCEDISEKKDFNNNFSQIQIICSFSMKIIKVGLHKPNFSPAMHGWGVFPNNKKCSMQKKNICKIDVFHQNKHDHQICLQIFSQVFEK